MQQSIAAPPSRPSGRPFQAVGQRAAGWWLAHRSETLALAGLLALIFSGLLFRLKSIVLSDMDEGTYLYAGRLLAEGQIPYRDFMLAHPPGVAVLAAGWIKLFGPDVMAARVAYMVLVLASTIPLYLITRELARSRTAGLFSIAVYTTGMLFIANMGRTVRLEPLMNGCLIAAFACYLLRPNSLRWRAATGAFLALAVLFKVVALVPAGLLVIGDLLWVRPDRRFIRSWAAGAAGAAVVLVPAGLVLLAQPNFIDDVFRSQVNRPVLPLNGRLTYLRQNFLRYPVIPVALVAAAWLVVRARDARVRVVSLVALGATFMLVFAFRTFFNYYIVQVLPWFAIVFTVVAVAVTRLLLRRWWQPALVAGVIVVGFVGPLLYGEMYRRTADGHVSSPARVVSQLRGGDGYLYSMYPSFALASGRELYPWYAVADSLIPRITGQIGDADFVRVFSGSQALVLWSGELSAYPRARGYVESHFQRVYEDAYFILWMRSGSALEPDAGTSGYQTQDSPLEPTFLATKGSIVP